MSKEQFYMKIDLISQGRENVLFLPSNMAAVTSHENALFKTHVTFENISTSIRRGFRLHVIDHIYLFICY